ncbi:MAG: hypothetical protein ACO388_07730 [Saprospiraceae bacterium]|jgi:hypothetical protein
MKPTTNFGHTSFQTTKKTNPSHDQQFSTFLKAKVTRPKPSPQLIEQIKQKINPITS